MQLSQQEKKMTKVIAAEDRYLDDSELALITGGRASGGGSGGSSGGGIEGYSKLPLLVVLVGPPDLSPML
jgi:hypothetical protein